jgi:hypothetical protein
VSVSFYRSRKCLGLPWFASLEEARQVIDVWRFECNTERPHRALKQRTPAAMVEYRTHFGAPVSEMQNVPPSGRGGTVHAWSRLRCRSCPTPALIRRLSALLTKI